MSLLGAAKGAAGKALGGAGKGVAGKLLGGAAGKLAGGSAARSTTFPFRPRAKITIAGRQLKSTEAALVRLVVSLSFGAHDAAQVFVWADSKFKAPSPGDSMSIAIGDDGGETDVWTGEVVAVSGSADGVVIDGLAATISLSRRRTSQTYLAQSIADIVNDLAGPAPVDQVQADTQLDAYAVDDRRTVWSHILDLAAIAGADVGSSPSGGLRFVPPLTGSASTKLRHGAELLLWSAGAAPAPDASTVAPYGAASQAGSAKWHWLLNSPPPSGSGAGPLRVVAGVRTSDAADAMAQALEDRAARATLQGRLVATGNPDLRPGDLVEAKGLPSGDLGPLRVTRVEHVLDARKGFVTSLSVEAGTP